MKRIFALLLISGIVYLSSCGDGGNDPLPPVVKPDSTSKGDTFIVNYASLSGTPRNFLIVDYVKNNSPYYEMYASVIYNATDSLWHCRIQLIDNKMKKLSLKLALTNTSPTGTFTIPDNTSTFIDYTEGSNATYEVSMSGSSVNITHATYPIQGTYTLTLYRNFKTYTAYGQFKIFP
ncbi:MAG: hypothetical protein K0Q79_3558 [Flavipsychrobacter sp.]|jgi:hypothetical protein|nr:hypothetical protein [Flavipsychrobacter sp.]